MARNCETKNLAHIIRVTYIGYLKLSQNNVQQNE